MPPVAQCMDQLLNNHGTIISLEKKSTNNAIRFCHQSPRPHSRFRQTSQPDPPCKIQRFFPVASNSKTNDINVGMTNILSMNFPDIHNPVRQQSEVSTNTDPVPRIDAKTPPRIRIPDTPHTTPCASKCSLEIFVFLLEIPLGRHSCVEIERIAF